MLGSTWSEAFQRGGQDGKEATHSGADHHCTAGGRGRSGPRQIREANQPGASRTHDGRALKLLTVLDEQWRREYNTVRPHSACGGFPPAPEAIKPSPWFLRMPVLHGPPQVLGLT